MGYNSVYDFPKSHFNLRYDSDMSKFAKLGKCITLKLGEPFKSV